MNRGCINKSLAEGRNSEFCSKHLSMRSRTGGERLSGMGGGSIEEAICSESEKKTNILLYRSDILKAIRYKNYNTNISMDKKMLRAIRRYKDTNSVKLRYINWIHYQICNLSSMITTKISNQRNFEYIFTVI